MWEETGQFKTEKKSQPTKKQLLADEGFSLCLL